MDRPILIHTPSPAVDFHHQFPDGRAHIGHRVERTSLPETLWELTGGLPGKSGTKLYRDKAHAQNTRRTLVRLAQILASGRDPQVIHRMLIQFAREDASKAGLPQGSLDHLVEKSRDRNPERFYNRYLSHRSEMLEDHPSPWLHNPDLSTHLDVAHPTMEQIHRLTPDSLQIRAVANHQVPQTSQIIHNPSDNGEYHLYHPPTPQGVVIKAITVEDFTKWLESGKRGVLKAFGAKGAGSPLHLKLKSLRPHMARAAQEVYDNWDQSDPDDEFGGGGICDRVSDAIGNVLSTHGIDHIEGGAEGDGHAFKIAHDDHHAFYVDIPHQHYERGGGYSWTKVPGFKFNQEHVGIEPIPHEWIDDSIEKAIDPDHPLTQWAEEARSRYGLTSLHAYPSLHDDWKLHNLIVPKESRGQGVGSAVITELTNLADKHGARVILSPGLQDDRHGTTSRGRLVNFYKRFGFVENKGRKKDFRISEGMYRDPKARPIVIKALIK